MIQVWAEIDFYVRAVIALARQLCVYSGSPDPSLLSYMQGIQTVNELAQFMISYVCYHRKANWRIPEKYKIHKTSMFKGLFLIENDVFSCNMYAKGQNFYIS